PSATPHWNSSPRICSSAAPNNQHRSQHRSGRPRSPVLMRPGPRRRRLFGRTGRGTHTRHDCLRSTSDSETSFRPYVERVRRSGLTPRKCFRSPARRAADIDVCRKPIAAGAVLVPDAFSLLIRAPPRLSAAKPGPDVAGSALENRHPHSARLAGAAGDKVALTAGTFCTYSSLSSRGVFERDFCLI